MTDAATLNAPTKHKICELGLAVVDIEEQAIRNLKQQIDINFVRACEYLLACKGRIIVTGMGKSGHIANKIAATLASTGSPAFFVHPGEASHGDMGMITPNDVVIAISNSGSTQELLTILPFIKRLGVPLISLTGNPKSALATNASIHLNVSVDKEACPFNLAPTASTTTTLVMGDALAIALLQSRHFTKEDFALSHPGGTLGRRLLLKISDIMHTGKTVPKVFDNASLSEALLEMTQKSMGMTAIVDKDQCVMGIFTDGDLRRAFNQNINVNQVAITEVMTSPCKTINNNMLAAEALNLMETHRINALLIVNADNQLVGAVSMHDFLRANVL